MRCFSACLVLIMAIALSFGARPALCAAAARTETVRLHGLCVRQAPTSRSKIVRALPRGARVGILGRKGDWVQVFASNGDRGWVYGGYLTGFNIKVPALYAARLAPAKSAPAPPAAAKSLVAAPAAPYAPGFSRPAPDRAPLDAYIDRLRRASSGKPAASAKNAQAAMSAAGTSSGLRRVIEIYLDEHRLYLFEKLPDGSRRLVRDYVVATPSSEVESPQGWGVVTGVDFDPWWVPTENMKRRARKKGRVLPNSVRPGLKSNPMGTFKILLSHGFGFRIHGNNNPSSIGRSVTSGCIRMQNGEGEEMARMIHVGDEVVFF